MFKLIWYKTQIFYFLYDFEKVRINHNFFLFVISHDYISADDIELSEMATTDSAREKALADYRKKLLEHKELEARLKESMWLLFYCIVSLFSRLHQTEIIPKMLCHNFYFRDYSIEW